MQRPRMSPNRTTCITARCSIRPPWCFRRRWRWLRRWENRGASCWWPASRATRSASASANSLAARITACFTPLAPRARWLPRQRSVACSALMPKRCCMPSVQPAPSPPGCGSSCAMRPTPSSCIRRMPLPQDSPPPIWRMTASLARNTSSKGRKAWPPAPRPMPIRRAWSMASARAGPWPRPRSSSTPRAATTTRRPMPCCSRCRPTISPWATSTASSPMFIRERSTYSAR